jgi:1-acyl-sn-glycerol-3-phosphate acyltransferase
MVDARLSPVLSPDMPRAVEALDTLRSRSRGAGFLAWTAAVVYSHRAIARLRPEIDSAAGRRPFVERWSKGMLRIFGLTLDLVHGRKPKESGPFLIVSNHRSPFDIVVCVHLMDCIVLSRDGVGEMPFLGYVAAYCDTIFVNREDPQSGARAIRQIRSRLKEGRNVLVFPEGTTLAGDEVRPFKRGAFTAAKGLSEVRVLPIGIAVPPGFEYVNESFEGHLSRVSKRPRTPIFAAIGEPRAVPKNAEEEEALRRVIQELVDRAAEARDR